MYKLLASFSFAVLVWIFFSIGVGSVSCFCSSIEVSKTIILSRFCSIAFLTALFFVLEDRFLFSQKRWMRIVAYFVFSFAFFLLIRGIQRCLATFGPSSLTYKIGWVLFVLAFFSLLFFFFKKNNLKCVSVLHRLFLMLSFFAIWQIGVNVKDFFFLSPQPLSSLQPQMKKSPIIWILFDELDTMALSLDLKELKAFQKNSVDLKKCYHAGSCTVVSIPSLLTGKKVERAAAFSSSSLSLYGKKVYNWESTKSIFSVAYELGYNPALIGWYLPYEKVLKGLTYRYVFGNNGSTSVVSEIIESWRVIFQQFPIIFSKIKDENNFSEVLGKNPYLTLLEKTNEVAIDGRYDFVFLHLSVPHDPPVESVKNDLYPVLSGYLRNLKEVDQVLKEIKEKFILLGIWDRAMVIVTADHGSRILSKISTQEEKELVKLSRIGQVPLLIKMPFQKEGRSFEKSFHAHRLFHLLKEVMKGKINSEDDLIAWLDQL